ncbi:hypothetical protein ACH5A2_40615, partial [Streptomyces collinus]|uniref:hypothetical protein n=1 Tax=Streptomyces collinus TaxID=42684 RepID=UPI003787E53D
MAFALLRDCRGVCGGCGCLFDSGHQAVHAAQFLGGLVQESRAAGGSFGLCPDQADGVGQALCFGLCTPLSDHELASAPERLGALIDQILRDAPEATVLVATL